jgi:2-phosphosulfolactate phosphatase
MAAPATVVIRDLSSASGRWYLCHGRPSSQERCVRLLPQPRLRTIIMQVEVTFVPRLASDVGAKVCVVVDALRATSTLVVLIERGVEEVVVCGTLAEARRVARRTGHLLCGEVNSLPPPDFDHGNSPTELAALDLGGRSAVLYTTNGTRALRRVAHAHAVIIGALLNRRATASAALAEAADDRDIAIVCAGRGRGRYFSLEDTFVAGALVDSLLTQASGQRVHPWNDALAALRLYRSYRGRALACFRQADHGRSLMDLGLGHDLDFCARTDVSTTVPRLRRSEDGLLRVVPA